MKRTNYIRRINYIRKQLPGVVFSLMTVTLLACACGKAKTTESGTPVAGQGVPALTVSPKGVDTPTVVFEKVAATPTLTQVRPTNAPTATHTPRRAGTPTDTPPPTPTPGPTGTPTTTFTRLPPTPTPEPAVYVVRAGDSLAAIAQAYGVTVAAITEANGIQDANTIHVGQELVIPDPARVPAGPVVQSPPPVGDGGQAAAASLPTPEQLPDTDPGPPFAVEISLNRVTPDPLVETSRTYLVTGIVRNDGNETYAVSDILVTFYDAEGFRGVFEPAIREGRIVGGEWHWHGETNAEFAALLLAPGEEWPFLVAIVGQDMVSFLVHPDAAPTGRESASVELSGVQMVDTGLNYVRIRGTATNVSPFKVKNVIVSGALIDAGGQIVSVGSTFCLEEDVAPGASVRFDMRVEKESYARYRLYAQAERDWD